MLWNLWIFFRFLKWELKQQLKMIVSIETPINDKLKQQFNIVKKN
jgi:hypothetical protein